MPIHPLRFNSPRKKTSSVLISQGFIVLKDLLGAHGSVFISSLEISMVKKSVYTKLCIGGKICRKLNLL